MNDQLVTKPIGSASCRCDGCRFSHESCGTFNCRRHPPQDMPVGTICEQMWPRVHPGHWCGDWQPRDQAVAGSSTSAGSANLSWIRLALNAGGTLTVKSVVPGNALYFARMTWPGEKSQAGKASTGVAEALRELDGALMLDCAEEMMNSDGV